MDMFERNGAKAAIKTVVGIMLVILWGINMAALAQDTKSSEIGLHMAVLQGNINAIEHHIKTGSDLNEIDAFGSAPLALAATFGRADAARVLISGGANPEIRDAQASAPLHIAALLGRADIARALLDAGANRQSRNGAGATAFDIASSPVSDDETLLKQLSAALGSLGCTVNRQQIAAARPQIARWLRPSTEALAAVNYKPISRKDWSVSTPDEQGLDPMLMAELYLDAAALETLHGVLVIKNGYLVAEGYFNAGSIDQKASLQSVSKSVYSTLVGLALEQGCLSGLDQKMMDFFPEIANRPVDPRKLEITIRDMLRMRSGYPWEESDPDLWKTFLAGDYLPLLEAVPLVSDPDAEFRYSNLTTHWLGMIVSRACDTDLRSFAEQHLFKPIELEPGDWWQDKYGFYFALLHMTACDAARFGLLYLNNGKYDDRQVVPSGWVRDSLQAHSTDASPTGTKGQKLGRYFVDIGYGYQWWSASVGDHDFEYAAGHGGQLIVLLDALDMIIVVTADPFFMQHDDEAWRHERANINLVGKFIASLPKAGASD